MKQPQDVIMNDEQLKQPQDVIMNDKQLAEMRRTAKKEELKAEKRRSTEIQSDEMRRAIKDQFGEMQEKCTASPMQDHYIFQLLHEHIKKTECHTDGMLSQMEFVSFQQGVLNIHVLDSLTRTILVAFRKPAKWSLDLRQYGIKNIYMIPCNNHNNHNDHIFQVLQEHIRETEYEFEDMLSSLEFVSFQQGMLTVRGLNTSMREILLAYKKPQQWSLALRRHGVREISLLPCNNHNDHIFQLLCEHIKATEQYMVDKDDIISILKFISFQYGKINIVVLDESMRQVLLIYNKPQQWSLALRKYGVRQIKLMGDNPIN